MEQKKQKWIIDTDPGIDDMMAILYMLNQKDIEIFMIGTIDGNVGLDITTNNTKKILKISQKNIPVYKGAPYPIIKTYDNIESFHKTDGFGDIEEIKNFEASEIPIEKENSSVKIVEYILKYPNEINLLLLGPLTNIATAYMLEPSICDLVKSVYIMGGSLKSRGNQNCPGEFNFAYDFIAAKIVLSNFKNLIITPWEPTEVIYFRDHHLEQLSKSLISQNKLLNQHVHLFVKLVIAKYTEEINGIQFCDLYSAMSIYSQHCVNKFSICKIDVIIDSKQMLGMTYLKEKKNVNQDFETYVNSTLCEKDLKSYILMIEEFNQEKVILAYEKVLLIGQQ